MLLKCLVVALAIAAAVAAPASAQVVDVPSESECVADQKAMSDALQAFLVTLVTRTCNLRTGYEHVCEAPCQAAIANIGTVAKGCLRYPSFGDTVFDMMRTTAENAGLGGEVPPKQAMNMTELNDWAVEYCTTSLFTGSPDARSCKDMQVYTDRSGSIDLPADALDGDGYNNYLRCLFLIQPTGGVSPSEYIKLGIEDMDMGNGDILTVFSGRETTTFPIVTLTGRSRPLSPIYGMESVDSLLLGFSSDAFSNSGSGFRIRYEVSDDDIDELAGCNDPLALNFDPNAIIPKTTTCEYDITDGSLLFQGSSGHVEVPAVDVLEHLPKRDLTMSTWVKVNELTESRYTSYLSHMQDDFLIEKGFAFGNINLPELAAGISPVLSHSCAIFTDVHEGFQIGPGGYVFSELDDTNGESNIKFGEWQHVACTYNGIQIKLFVDGELVATSDAQIGDIAYPASDYVAKQSNNLLTIGAYHDNDDYYTMHGELDEMMLFNCAIPDDEIVAAASGRGATVAMANENRDCLMHWYRFNEKDAADIVDEIEGELHGIIVDILGDQVFRAETDGILPP